MPATCVPCPKRSTVSVLSAALAQVVDAEMVFFEFAGGDLAPKAGWAPKMPVSTMATDCPAPEYEVALFQKEGAPVEGTLMLMWVCRRSTSEILAIAGSLSSAASDEAGTSALSRFTMVNRRIFVAPNERNEVSIRS